MTDPSDTELAVFKAAIETAPEAVFWMDGDGRFVYVNQRACSSLGYSREDLSRLHIWDIDPGVDLARWRLLWSQTPVGRTLESEHRRKDGSMIPVEVSAEDLQMGRTRLRVAFARDISERKAVTAALRRTQFAVDQAREAIFWIRSDARLVYVNEAACRSLEYTREELLALTVIDFDPNLTAQKWAEDWQRSREGGVIETVHRSKSGRLFPVEIAVSFMRFEGDEYKIAYARDISERKRAEADRARLEAQLLHAQKLESVGRLAGGVAHDFNNMLAVILGYAELTLKRMPDGDPLLEGIQEIRKAALHSRNTTEQLLAFSRKQIIAPRPVDLNDVVAEAKKALLRLIGEDIHLDFVPGAGLWKIHFDPSQMDQILLNLVVNARDALEGGGKIAVATANVHLDEAFCRDRVDATPGDYVVLSVSDNGTGIDPQTLPHIFDPFFTTKEVGRGTGLGLATVYGVIKQNGGFVTVCSESGRGTTFHVYVPRLRGTVAEPKIEAETRATGGEETILLVEDDEMVRNLAKTMLESLGYSVLAAATPESALSLCQRGNRAIALLMSDVVMPHMGGPELRREVQRVCPGVRVLFMSGHAPDAAIRGGTLDEDAGFLQKPFTLGDLARSVKAAIRRPHP
jgi:PAS domain S-box-containing protein